MGRVVLWAIRHDPRWSEYYDAGRRLEAAAGGDALGEPQLDHLESMLFAELDRRAPERRLTRTLVRGGAILVPVAAGLLFAATRTEEPPPPRGASEIQERGQKTVPPTGLRVHCLTPDAKSVVVTAEVGPREPLDALSCPAGGLLGFSVTNLHDEEVFLFVVGLAAGDVRWYAPFTSRSSSVRLAPGVRDHPLDILADTSPFPAGEEVTLYALFSARPLMGVDVERQLDSAARAGRLDSASGRLPVAADWQGRIEVRPPPTTPLGHKP